MAVNQAFPPSKRDFDVYEHVELGGMTTRQAASYFDLSQSRVCQIVERVAEWQASVVPRRAHQFLEEDLLVLAKNMAGQRLHNLYGEALDAWRKSQTETYILKRKTGEAISSTTTKNCFGQVPYLHVAIRAVKEMASLAVLPGLIEGLQAAAIEQATVGADQGNADATHVEVETVSVSDGAPAPEVREPEPAADSPEDEPQNSEAVEGETSKVETSPVGDCSRFGELAGGASAENAEVLAPTSSLETASAAEPATGPLPVESANGPVQPLGDRVVEFPDVGDKAGELPVPVFPEGQVPRMRVVGWNDDGVPIVVVELSPDQSGAAVHCEPSAIRRRRERKRQLNATRVCPDCLMGGASASA